MSSSRDSTSQSQQELLERAKQLGLRALTLVDGLRVGDQASPMRGFSIEFAQHREYVPGDDLRHLDWRGYARTERFIVKQYDQETNYTAHILLDLSGSMAYGKPGESKYEQAQLLAAVISQVGISQANAIGIKILEEPQPGEPAPNLPPSTKPDRLRLLLDSISRRKPIPERNRETQVPIIETAIRELSDKVGRRGLVVIISDLFEPWEPLMAQMQGLRIRGHDVMVLHVLHSHEIDLPWEGQVQFEDLESSDFLLTQPHLLRASYQKALQDWLEQIKSFCTKSRIEYVLVPSDQPPDESLLSMLAQRLKKRRIGRTS